MEEDRKDKERNASWLSVPQFGDWDQKGGALPDYSLDFSKIREMRKQNKRDPSRASLGNEEDFINPTAPANIKTTDDDHHFNQNHSPTDLTKFGDSCYSTDGDRSGEKDSSATSIAV